MHSLSMAESILEAALDEARKNDARHIKTIEVKVVDTFTEADSLLFCLELMSKRTIAEGACIRVTFATPPTRDPGCPHGLLTDREQPPCSSCSQEHAEEHQGREIISVALELD
ncbi:MAG: hydrogenase maturation nickel metallochaperone HypA [Chloroflexota bacterium]